MSGKADAPPAPRVMPKKTTREALLRRIHGHRKKTRYLSGAAETEDLVDCVLEAMDAFSRPYLENDWTGGEVLHQLRIWRKTRL